jgi:hypothetical protein
MPFCAAGIKVQRAYFAEKKGVVFDGASAHTSMLSARKEVGVRFSF